jgi:predicted O-methyltransferase YrrM
MARQTLGMSDPLYDYLLSVSLREPDILRRCREETAEMAMSTKQISPDEGQLLALLTRLSGARRTIEVGVFTGYSAMCVALAMPEDGRIIACDIDEDWTAVARRYWQEAGIAHKIDLRLAPAGETLDDLIEAGLANHFDMAFIDADKSNYGLYYEQCMILVRPGGLILVDNVLWYGRVVDETYQDADTAAIRAINKMIYADKRVEICMVPIGDGLTIAYKR